MKKIFFYLLLILISEKTFAQHELSGKITDKKTNSPLIGVTVYIPDLKLGSATDSSGNYVIKNIPKGTFLAVISFLGYASQTKEVEIKS